MACTKTFILSQIQTKKKTKTTTKEKKTPPALSCPLNFQPVQADGCPRRVWFCQRFLPIKRDFFLSIIISCLLRTRDWIKSKFLCSIVASLARQLFLNGLCRNWTNLESNEIDLIGLWFITMNWILIGLNWTVSLKCLQMTFIGIWRYINKTELNNLPLNESYTQMSAAT